MAFKISSFSYDLSGQHAQVYFNGDHGEWINTRVAVIASPEDTLEQVKKKTLKALRRLFDEALRDVEQESQAESAGPQGSRP